MQGVFITNTKTSPMSIGKTQEEIEEVLKSNPAVKNFVLISGVSSFVNQNMGFGFILLEPKSKRPPISDVANQINGRVSLIPGVISAFSPEPTLKISTGATSTQNGK